MGRCRGGRGLMRIIGLRFRVERSAATPNAVERRQREGEWAGEEKDGGRVCLIPL